jgi:hypothetical protein
LLCQQPRKSTTAAPVSPVAVTPKGQSQRDFFFFDSSATACKLLYFRRIRLNRDRVQ